MSRFYSLLCGGWFVLAMLSSTQATAGVVITGTRLIYPSDQKEITVKLNNNGSNPALVQAWIDTGDLKSSPTSSKAPFVLSPPVSRIDASKGQSLRMVFTGAPLPADKESVFWLNVLEIPPKAEGPVDLNVLQMAFRTRIKIFYRPQGLAGTSTDAPKSLEWKIVVQGKGYGLEVFNPTAYHVSLADLGVTLAGKYYQSESGMIKPGSKHVFAVEGLQHGSSSAGEVKFNAINDYGAMMPFTQNSKF